MFLGTPMRASRKKKNPYALNFQANIDNSEWTPLCNDLSSKFKNLFDIFFPTYVARYMKLNAVLSCLVHAYFSLHTAFFAPANNMSYSSDLLIAVVQCRKWEPWLVFAKSQPTDHWRACFHSVIQHSMGSSGLYIYKD